MRSFFPQVIVVGLLSLAGCAGPQQLAPTGEAIPQKTNTIYITTDDPPEEAYRKMGRILQAAGYNIESAEEALGAITTAYRPVKQKGIALLNGPLDVKLFASILEDDPTRLQLKGEWRNTANETSNYISLYGAKNSLHRNAWSEMQSIAERYEGATLSFGRIDMRGLF